MLDRLTGLSSTSGMKGCRGLEGRADQQHGRIDGYVPILVNPFEVASSYRCSAS